MMVHALAGKNLVITGAGTGIGAAVARLAVEAGAHAVLVGRRADALRSCVEQVDRAHRANLVVCPADIGDEDSTAELVDTALAELGHVDGLVNNAGIARFASLENADLADLALMFRVHVSGPAQLIRGLLPSLRQQRGSVVNVTSVGGSLATPNRSFYGATKAAINHLTRSLAIELAPEVRVNAILPGPVDTPIYDDLGMDQAGTDALRNQLISATPLGRFGTPDEVAAWVCQLLSPAGAWITGTLLPIDGGRCA
ncbi:SDR family NAD(P)-dependent oxidoreductase [Lentzea jiangxiensis]|uniref:NAD(P)-dependent dehydrogenase, short-chain alcohol dehydrogenase family n=1 Tax=Lentzea jiangxiensis TaxID=641025 RepID=A0A1H0WUK9_9PSEU|nr:SDR family oxidoreductase [Lentzea jiangxiensis]SDP94270.1 NAD(P)-dependent dehydrogenase, short-chain alcohol dehydrogenase family [Lentzea jiangxiensis]